MWETLWSPESPWGTNRWWESWQPLLISDHPRNIEQIFHFGNSKTYFPKKQNQCSFDVKAKKKSLWRRQIQERKRKVSRVEKLMLLQKTSERNLQGKAQEMTLQRKKSSKLLHNLLRWLLQQRKRSLDDFGINMEQKYAMMFKHCNEIFQSIL